MNNIEKAINSLTFKQKVYTALGGTFGAVVLFGGWTVVGTAVWGFWFRKQIIGYCASGLVEDKISNMKEKFISLIKSK